MQCASLKVPLDYRNPGGRKITLALSRVPATAPASQRQGALLVNPGGPGGSGLSLAAVVASGLAPSVAADYDVIGFDPRGVGSSTPALHCDASFFAGVRPDYIPANGHDEQVLEARAKTYAADCEKSYGWLLPYMTTANAARDMDSIRVALGQQKISYFAYSYGTYLGEVYATLFGSHLRRMALDSVVDPTGVWYQDNIAQDYAFQGRMTAFFTWVASHDNEFQLGTTAAEVRQAWYRVRAKLAAHPVMGSSGPMIGTDEFDDTFLQGGYTDSLWPGLASALSGYDRTGNTGSLISQYEAFGAQNENEFAVYNAVQCADVNWPRNWARWDTRHPHRLPDGAVPGLGQRLVQRGVRLLAGAGPGSAHADQGQRPAWHPHDPGHAGRGHAVRGRTAGAPGAADRADGGRRGRRKPRAVARRSTQHLRGRLPQPLPGHRRASAAPRPGQRHMPGPSCPFHQRLSGQPRDPAGRCARTAALRRHPGGALYCPADTVPIRESGVSQRAQATAAERRRDQCHHQSHEDAESGC